jgi:hypothetical protein
MVKQELFSVEKDLVAARAFSYKHPDIPAFEAGEAGQLLSDAMVTFVG